MPKTYHTENTIIGPSITYVPWHPMSYSRGGRIGDLQQSAYIFPVDQQRNNILFNHYRSAHFNRAQLRATINPFN